MNKDTVETVEQFAKETGAIVKCKICRNNYVRAFDGEADRQTYARATNEWKSGGHAFRDMDREEVMGVVKSVLDSANLKCPSCG